LGVKEQKKAAIGVALLLLLSHSMAFADQVTDRAKGLIQRKNAQAAYQLLKPLEAQRAGDPEYDYLLGISALDSGQREHAVFALERVLAVDPNNAQARAEIARAYFELDEKENAKREFTSVRAGNPPEAVKQTIDRYLSALEAGPKRFSGFFELGFGHDSNVNSATATSQIAVPALGGAVVTLDSDSVKRSDNFATANGALNFVYDFNSEWAVLAGAAASGKFNNNLDQFDTDTLDGNVGLRWAHGQDSLSTGFAHQTFDVDNKGFRNSDGLIAQWQHNYSEFSQISLFAQAADLSYPAQPIRNARRTIAGAAFGYGVDNPRKPIVFGSLYGGREKENAEGVPQLGHKLVGVRLGGQVGIDNRSVLFTLLSYEQRDYGGDEPFFNVTRRDKQTDFRVGVNYTLAPGWLLVPQVAYTSNESNVQINKYTRTVATISVRWTF
jgi:outer membrane protein